MHEEPWDPREPDYFETGPTKPPKSHGGLIVFLAVLVIVLGSLVCMMGAWNVRRFVREKLDRPDTSLEFSTKPSDGITSGEKEPTRPSDLPQSGGLTLEDPPGTVPNVPQEGGLSLQEIYEKAIPSVVSITCETSSGTASGTGVVMSADGYLVTNHHVVKGASAIRVRLTDDRALRAALVASDPVADLAVLYVQAEGLTAAEFGDSSTLRVGDAVAAIGDPLGEAFRGTMTNGIVSAINRDVEVNGRTMTLIQTNAALNSGNSGGPLLNCYGQVIGINVMKIGAFADDAGVEGLGFAIPSRVVKEIVDQLLTQGYVTGRPTLGVEGEGISLIYQRYYRLPAGFLVTGLTDDSPAAQAGLAVGDLILDMGDDRITDEETLNEALMNYAAGERVTLTIYRNSRQYTTQVVLGDVGA